MVKSPAAYSHVDGRREKDATEKHFFNEQNSGVFSQINPDQSRATEHNYISRSPAEFNQLSDVVRMKTGTEIEHLD